MRPGEKFDRYVIERVLGEGGMATVYLGRHETLGSEHALKVLRVDVPAIRQRLMAEGRVQSGIRHPNVVAVTDILDTDRAVALVMEFVDGPALDEYQDAKPLPLDEVRSFFRGVVLGVAEAHQKGVVHRDLKSANVLLHRASNVGVIPKVTDFGLVKVFESSGTKSGVTMGTPEYMSPEQVRDSGKVDPRSDLWSLGVLLYEMLTGDVPFDGDDLLEIYNAIAHARYAPVTELRPDAPPDLVALIDDLLVVDPADRIQTAEEILARLDTAVEVPAPAPVPSSRPSWPLLVLAGAALGLVAVAGVALAALVYTSRPTDPDPDPERDVVVTITGIPESMDRSLHAGRFAFDGHAPLKLENREVPSTLRVRWAYGPGCDTCPEACPSWCARGEELVDLVMGEEAQDVRIDLPPPDPVREVVVATGQPLAVARLGDVVGVIDGSTATFGGVPAGGHEQFLQVGSCEDEDRGCHERENCPPGCISSVITLGVPPGAGPVERPYPLPPAGERPVEPAPVPVPVPSPTPAPWSAPAPVGGVAFARFIERNPQWARDAAIAAGRADRSYLSDWSEGPPAGPVDRVSWAAARAYCASRGGLLPLDAEPAQWAASSAVKQEWRDAGGRPAWRRFDGVTSTNARQDQAVPFTGFRCRR